MFESDHEAWIMRRPWPTKGVVPWGEGRVFSSVEVIVMNNE